jgi:FAD:protein FMN transferase
MTKRKLYFNLPFLLFLIIGTIYITYQQKSTTYQKSEGKIFGTFSTPFRRSIAATTSHP